MTSLETLMKDL